MDPKLKRESKSSTKLSSRRFDIHSQPVKQYDLQKYSTNFQVKALQAKTNGFFGFSKGQL
jgi:hypothetical protein